MAGNKNSGRPEFEPTDEDREKVRVLKAGGMTDLAIAEVIGVSDKTLRKHFASEIDRATARVRAEVLMARYRSAMGGNVSAQNKMLELVGAAAADKSLKKPKAEKPGKKEVAQQNAEKVASGDRYAVRQPPRLVADNTK